MDKRVQDSVIAKQEKAARQQELLEKKRQARAEYNISGGRSGEQREKKHQEQVLKKQQKQLEIRQEKQEKKKDVQPESGNIRIALSKKTHPAKKNFARGYLIYRCLVLILSVTVLYVLYQIGLNFIDQMLSFVK